MKNRRDFLKRAFGLGAGLATSPRLLGAASQASGKDQGLTHANRAFRHDSGTISVETPDVPQLSWRVVDGAKEFHLIAEPVKQELIPGKVVNLWGYNGSAPGPTIQVTQGDRVRIIVDNHLPESTSMHWHGFGEMVVHDDSHPVALRPLGLLDPERARARARAPLYPQRFTTLPGISSCFTAAGDSRGWW